MKLKLCNNGLSVCGTNGQGFFVSYSIESIEYKQWLEEGNTPEPEFTDEELSAKELNEKIDYARQYLSETEWVKDYKLRHDLGLDSISADSSKWLIITKRTEYIKFLKEVE